MNKTNISNLLDKTRLNGSVDDMKNLFDKLVKNNTTDGLELLNDQTISFTSLFILQDKIDTYNIFQELNPKNKIALEFVKLVKDEKKDISFVRNLSYDQQQLTQPTLKWILETGYFDDNLNDEFDEVLDTAAILLIKSYDDKSDLPIISDLIFERYKKGFYIHDIVWAFFESCEPKSLHLVAGHLNSTDVKEVELASKLLSFIPGISINSPKSNEEKYTAFIKWFEENNPFLHYTGESLQLTSEPIPYEVKLDAKYLCKGISVDNGQFIESLTNREFVLLNSFKKLDDETKILLSSFSYMIYRKDNTWWQEWIKYPISSQINVAKAKGGLL